MVKRSPLNHNSRGRRGKKKQVGGAQPLTAKQNPLNLPAFLFHEKGDPIPSSSDEEEVEQEGGIRVAGVYVPPAPPAVCSADSVGPRLIITHIANENFKSYAGRQVLGPFHKSFTSIIGPNGSGKSNVIDSMLFVFGYRATKIRSKKISVLLHKSEDHQNVKSATVEVHFVQIIDKEGDDYEVVPKSEFYISRTAFHDNSSHYTISGKRAQFKDVAQLLGRFGIDLKHNRFLILQGEVEQIAMMKPRAPNEHESGMLEYLEDVIGTDRYKKPLDKLERRLMRLQEERQEKLVRLKLAEKDKEALEGPMQHAVKYIKSLNEITRSKNRHFQLLKYESELALKGLLEEKDVMDKANAEKKEKIKTSQETLAQKEKIVADKRKECEGLKSQKEKLVDSFNKVEKRATQLKEEITQTNKKRKKAMEAKKQEETKLADLEKVPEKNEKEIAELKILQQKLQTNRVKEEADLQTVLESLKLETRDLQEKKDEINNDLIGLNKKREDARAKYELAKTELSVYLSNENKEKEKLKKLKTTLDNTVSQLEEKKRILEDLQTKTPQTEQALLSKQKELSELKAEETRVMQDLNQQRSIMEEKKHTMSASASRNRVINFLMELKQKGEIPGIFGRLGDLGGIDAKYDCAVSTACGPLDYVVVDTSSTAKQCINALKRFNIGRGNFIALDQQNKFLPNCRQQFKGPENVPRLFDLIKVEDERVKPAFYFGLRDTLVAQDLAQARRVAYGATRYRVVTLNGEIIEIAGTMSGGGREKRTGRMGRSATVKTDVMSPGMMSRLEERVKQLQERASNIHLKINNLEQEISVLTRDLKKLKMDLTSTQIEVKNLSQQEPSLRNQVTNQEAVVARTVSDPVVVQQKTEAVETLKKEFDEAAAESGKLEKKVAELTTKINALTGGRMKAAQEKLDKVTKQLDKVSAEITKLTVAIKTSERNCKKSRDRIQALTTEIAEAEGSLTKAQEENKGLDEEAVKVNGLIEAISEKIVEVEATFVGERQEIAQLNKDISSMKSSLLSEQQVYEELEKKIASENKQIKQKETELASLKLIPIPNDETEDLELPRFNDDEVKTFDRTHTHLKILEHDEEFKDSPPDMKAIEEYNEKSEILKTRIAEVNEVTQKKTETKKGWDELRMLRHSEFMAGFAIINFKLKEMYQMITFGGDAELELLDSLDPFCEGIGFSVRPPKKSWKYISNLSGGEKTLSSLALVFALHYYKPSPLYVMDEIDAALDFKNVSIVGHYIKERTKNAQFIIISLRSNMFELADVLVGIYKTNNCTKSVTITPKLYAADEEATQLEDGSNENNSKRDTQERTGRIESSPKQHSPEKLGSSVNNNREANRNSKKQDKPSSSRGLNDQVSPSDDDDFNRSPPRKKQK